MNTLTIEQIQSVLSELADQTPEEIRQGLVKKDDRPLFRFYDGDNIETESTPVKRFYDLNNCFDFETDDDWSDYGE